MTNEELKQIYDKHLNIMYQNLFADFLSISNDSVIAAENFADCINKFERKYDIPIVLAGYSIKE